MSKEAKLALLEAHPEYITQGKKNLAGEKKLRLWREYICNITVPFQKDTTYISGCWGWDTNPKHRTTFYMIQIPKTLTRLGDQNLVYYYAQPEILDAVNEYRGMSDNRFISKFLEVENLPTWKISEDFLKSATRQDTQAMRRISPIKEMSVSVYNRDLLLEEPKFRKQPNLLWESLTPQRKKAGAKNYRKVFSIWTSKILLTYKIVNENPFNSKYFIWLDAGLGRFPMDWERGKYRYPNLWTHHTYPPNNSKEPGMRYKGMVMPIQACYMAGTKKVWDFICKKYLEELEIQKDSGFCHMEETILTELLNKYPGSHRVLMGRPYPIGDNNKNDQEKL